MTLKLQDGVTNYKLSFNIPNMQGNWTLSLKSQVSNTTVDIAPVALTIEETNDRYTEFSFNFPADLPLEHKNGVYQYDLSNNDTVHSGLLKLVCDTGGTDGYTSYESNNEEQEGTVYYRPEY